MPRNLLSFKGEGNEAFRGNILRKINSFLQTLGDHSSGLSTDQQVSKMLEDLTNEERLEIFTAINSGEFTRKFGNELENDFLQTLLYVIQWSVYEEERLPRVQAVESVLDRVHGELIGLTPTDIFDLMRAAGEANLLDGETPEEQLAAIESGQFSERWRAHFWKDYGDKYKYFKPVFAQVLVQHSSGWAIPPILESSGKCLQRAVTAATTDAPEGQGYSVIEVMGAELLSVTPDLSTFGLGASVKASPEADWEYKRHILDGARVVRVAAIRVDDSRLKKEFLFYIPPDSEGFVPIPTGISGDTWFRPELLTVLRTDEWGFHHGGEEPLIAGSARRASAWNIYGSGSSSHNSLNPPTHSQALGVRPRDSKW